MESSKLTLVNKLICLLDECQSSRDPAVLNRQFAEIKRILKEDLAYSLERAARFAPIFDQSADPIMTLEPPTWKFTSCNKAALRLFRVSSEEEFKSLGPWNLSPEKQPDQRPSGEQAQMRIAKAMEEGNHFFDWTHQTLDGQPIRCTVLLSRIDSINGTYLQATVRDASAERQAVDDLRKRTSELSESLLQLKDSELRFRSLFEALPMPCLTFDESGIVDCNSATVTILGGTEKNQILSKHPAVFSPEFQPDGRKSAEKSKEMDNTARTKGVHTFEWLHQSLHGESIPVEVTLTPFEFLGQNLMLVLWKDLREHYKSLEQLKEANEKIEAEKLKSVHSAKLASLGEMSAGIAHEINNPLAIISGNLKILEKLRTDEEKFKDRLETVAKSVARISKIVRGLAKFSRFSEADFQVESVATIVDESLILTSAKAQYNLTDIAVDLEPDLFINCDAVEIEQVLINLINNAIDAVKHAQEKWVRIKAFSEGHQIVLQVKDAGRGIPPEVEKKLFQPFFTTKPVGEGTGLGLSIVRGILESHSARIEINKHSKNTCFEIRFPMPTIPAKKPA